MIEVIYAVPPARTEMKLSKVGYPINAKSSAFDILTISWYDLPLISGLETTAILFFRSVLAYNYSGVS